MTQEFSGGWKIIPPDSTKGASALDALYGPGYRENLKRARRETGTNYGFTNEIVGPVADEIEGYVQAPIDWLRGQVTQNPQAFGDLLDERLEDARAGQAEFRDKHPIAAFWANMLGAAAVAPARAAQVGQAAVSGFWQKLGLGAKAGAVGGGIGGFAEGEGGPLGRLESGAVGAGVGAGVGTVIPAGGELVGRLVRGIARLRGLSGAGAETRAREMLMDALRKDGISLDDLVAKQSSGKPLTVADLGENTRRLIGSASRQSGPGATRVDDFFEGRTRGQFDRLSDDLGREMGVDPTALRPTRDAVAATRASDAATGYPAAYANAGPEISPAAKKILLTPAGRAAVRDATRFMANKRRPVKDATGNYTVEMLDQIQRAMRDQAQRASGQRASERAGNISTLRGEFLEELPDDLRGVMGQYRTQSELIDAMDLGRTFIRRDAEDVAADLAQMSEAQREMFRLGAAREIRAKMGAKGDGADASGMFQNPNMRERLREVFPDMGSFQRFMQATADERTMQETRNALLKGSQTAGRTVSDDEFSQGALGDAAVDLVRGRGAFDTMLGAAMRAGRDAKDRILDGLNERVAGELGRLGTETNFGGVASQLTPRAGLPATRAPGVSPAAPPATASGALGGSSFTNPESPKPSAIKIIHPDGRVDEYGAAPSSNEEFAIAGARAETPKTVKAALSVGENRAIRPILLARSFVGANERRDANVISTFIRKMTGTTIDPRQTPWCAAFVNAVLKGSGSSGTGSLAARSFMNFGEATEKPQVGDVVVLWRDDPNSSKGHVGFFAGREKRGGREFIRVLGGNQDNSVSEKLYPADRLLGYRRPPKLA